MSLTKKRLLWIGESPNSRNEFSKIIQHVGTYLQSEYELTVYGINNDLSMYMNRGYPVIETLDNTGIYGYTKLLSLINNWMPNIIVVVGDINTIINYTSKLFSSYLYNTNTVIIGYLLIGTENILFNQAKILDAHLDAIFVMTEFGKNECIRAKINKEIYIIPYGYQELYQPIDKLDARKQLKGLSQHNQSQLVSFNNEFDDEHFIILSSNINQLESRLDITIHGYVYFLYKYWKQNMKRKPLLLMDCALYGSGWSIIDVFYNLCKQYDLPIDETNTNQYLQMTYNTDCHPYHHGSYLNLLHSCVDIGIDTSMSQYWGTSTFYGASMERPQIIPDFSNISYIFNKGVYKIPTSDYFIHTSITSLNLGQCKIVNFKGVAEAINYYYTLDSETIKAEGKETREEVLKYNWSDTCNQICSKLRDVYDKRKFKHNLLGPLTHV